MTKPKGTRLGSCTDCHDWLVGSKTAPLPLRCDPCKRARQSQAHKRWKLANRDIERAGRRRYYHANRDRISAQRHASAREGRGHRPSVLRKYGLSTADYDAMLTAQSGLCAICSNPPGKIRLHVDHDHETGEVRGLLCAACNRGIGSLRDDPALLLSALAYLAAEKRLVR